MEQNKCNKCGRPIQYATEPKCNYCDACMNEYCGCKLGRIKEIEPTCDSTAVIPSVTVQSVEGITNLANCLVHVEDINTTFYVDDKHRVMITWAGPVDIPGYDMENNPNGYRDQIVTDVENETAVIYDKHGKGYLFGITPENLQEAINNKLDEMAANGTLETIVASYIEDVAHVFDTVADMKTSTDLVNGSYAKTLGFHTLNDGGGATYKITNAGTANEMDTIAVGSLYANLIYGDNANAKQFGAYGDDTHDDSSVFVRAASVASSNSIVFYVPKAAYKLTNQVSLKGLVVKCDGTLDNDVALVLGAHAGGGTSTTVNIFSCKNVQIEGSKRGYFNIRKAGDIVMYADGNTNNIASQAYNHIEGIECNSFTINGINGGWINENVINIKRCLSNITITGDGSYYHNNNRFTNISLEGSSKEIKINCGYYNFISYRGESNPTITLGPTGCFGNVIAKQYENLFYRIYNGADIDKNTSMNFVGTENLPTAKVQKIMDVNLSNIKNLNTGLNINSDGLIYGNYQTEYSNANIDPTKPFTIILKASVASQRVYLKCLDENDDGIQASVGSATIAWNNTNKRYQLNSDAKAASISYQPTDGVKKIQLIITSGTHAFEWATAYIASPFMNFDEYRNNVNTDKRYRSSAPSSNATYWEVGDIVYNSAPSAGGNIGWVCTVAGNPGTWKAFGAIEA